MDRYAAAGGPNLIAADTAFHRRVCLLAGHRRLLEAWDDLAQQVLALYTVTDVPGLMSRLYGYVEDTGDRHRPIVAAWGGDLEGLAKYISNHILEVPQLIIEQRQQATTRLGKS